MFWVWVVAIVIVFLTLLFGVALWEKHSVRAYGAAEEEGDLLFGPYLLAVDADAVRKGLNERSVHRHQRHALIASFWFSPRREVLVHSGEGSEPHSQVLCSSEMLKLWAPLLES